MKNLLLMAAVVAMLATTALAGPMISPPSAALVTSGDAQSGFRDGPNYSTGFETPPFALGPIEPQNGWAASGISLPWASVSTLAPHSGAQNLHEIRDATVAQGVNRVVNGATQVVTPAPSSTSIWVDISTTGGADYDFGVQAPTQGFVTTRIKNYFGDGDGDTIPGDVFYLDAPYGPSDPNIYWMNTGFDYTPGVYYQMEMKTVDTDLSGVINLWDTIEYWINGVHVVDGFVFAGTQMEQFYTVHDNWQNDYTEFGAYDDLVMTPEPGSLMLLGLGLVGLLRRR